MKQKKKGKRGVPARSRQAAARRIDWEQPILHALSEKEQSAEGLMHTLRVGKRERMGFLLQLSKLERSGRLERRKNGAYAISMENTLSGRLVSLSKGFGFAGSMTAAATALSPGGICTVRCRAMRCGCGPARRMSAAYPARWSASPKRAPGCTAAG